MSYRSRNLSRSIIAGGIPIMLSLINNAMENSIVNNYQQYRIRRENLVNKIMLYMDDVGTTPNNEALLTQVLNCSDADLHKFERVFEELTQPRIRIENIFNLVDLDTPPVETKENEIKETERFVTILFKDLEREVKSKKCVVCLENYKDEEKIEVRNCGHTYHSECANRWRNEGNLNCICCRQY